jgi:NADH-quinone oxidoreductase subunit G
MCYRCVRFHQEIPGDEALAAVDRGAESEIATATGEPYNSVFAGNTIELCPVGALTSRQYRFKARPWDLVRTPSICTGCSVGCNIEVHGRTESVLRLVSRENPSIDGGWLCDKGRFGTIPLPQRERAAQPLVRQGDALVAATWERAFERAVDVLGQGGSVAGSSSLSNEALWLLQRLVARLPIALWPAVGEAWPVSGSIQQLTRSKRIVLVGLDVWNELPILALWIRKAVLGGATLVVLGPANGLWRNTTEWLRGDPIEGLGDLLRALRASDSDSSEKSTIATSQSDGDPAAAAGALGGEGAASVLIHPSLVEGNRAQLEALVTALGASGESGMVGAPLLGANGRGAIDLAPDVVRGDTEQALASAALLVLGDEEWGEMRSGSFGRLVMATSQRVPLDDPRIEVVLPMAHAYERQGTITNLEGRLQHQDGGAAPPSQARADWSIVAGLSRRFGVAGPEDLEAIRSAIAGEHGTLAEALREGALVARG